MTLGKRIKERRQSSGLTQEDLAKITQITLQHISSIEQGKRTPSLNLLIKIAEQLKVSLDYLVLGKQTSIDTITALEEDDSLEDDAKKSLIKLIVVMRHTIKK
jgi:transcriptional regulator with XRE-family HTH domain